MKKTLLKYVILLVGITPLATKLPYMLNAWQTSRMDSFDWCFMLVALILFVVAWPQLRQTIKSFNWWFLFVAAVGFFLYAGGILYTIHAISILGAMLFLWGMVGVAQGVEFALTALPIFGILSLSCTSTTYWIGYFTGSNAFALKIIFAVILVALQIVMRNICRKIPVKAIFSIGALTLLLLLYFFSGLRYELFEPFEITLDHYSANSFVGRDIQPSEIDRHFFGKSNIQRAFYADEYGSVALLKVSEFDNVHKIHPAGHCLRSSGRDVVSENLRTIILPKGALQVNEIFVDNGDNTFMLVWAWYGNELHSSGSFIFFRKMYNPAEKWSAWQVAVNGQNDDISQARKLLEKFMTVFHDTSNGG